MKASRFSDTQKAFILKARRGRQAGGGHLSQGRHHPGDLFQLEKRHDGLLPTEMRRLKQSRTRTRSCARWWPTRYVAIGMFRSGEHAGCSCDTSTHHDKSRRPGQSHLEQRIREIWPNARSVWLSPRSRPAAARGFGAGGAESSALL